MNEYESGNHVVYYDGGWVRWEELKERLTAVASGALTNNPDEPPPTAVYAKRRGKLVLVGLQPWLPGTFTPR